jgi:membrane protein implicated in regulation of membrane protease activity
MVGTVLAAATLAILIVALISALENSAFLPSLTWIAFTAFPLAVVVMIATLARLQQRINVRSPQSGDDSGASQK